MSDACRRLYRKARQAHNFDSISLRKAASHELAILNGRCADVRIAVRQEKRKPILDDVHTWLLTERRTLSPSSEVLKPINYMLGALG
ncbi:hypothetical protein XH80_19665 [Bradyrhizobium sp. CCBAU 45384]|nr:hypothetical protein [Bradyrhizobium sp. CCBAU 45384]